MKTKFKANPKTFIAAAERIATFKDEFACNALGGVKQSEQDYKPTLKLFTELYYKDSDFLPRKLIWWDKGNDKEVRAARVIALLLAAEVAKDGGL